MTCNQTLLTAIIKHYNDRTQQRFSAFDTGCAVHVTNLAISNIYSSI